MRITALTLFLLAAFAVAGPGKGRMMEFLDKDQDGKISREEFPGPAERFAQLDEDGDGFLTEAETAKLHRGRRGRHGPRGHGLAQAADADKNGAVTAAEWDAFLATLQTDENGVVSHESLRAKLPEGRRGRGPGRDHKLEELRGLFAKLDQNGDQVIDQNELAPRPRGPRGGLVARAADEDKSGDVTAAEWAAFLLLVTTPDGVLSQEQLKALLEKRRGAREGEGRRGRGPRGGDRGAMLERALDHDKDGTVTAADLNAIFAQLDTNKDQALQSEEMPKRRGFGRDWRRGKPGPEEK